MHKLSIGNIPKDSILGLNYSGMHDSAIAIVSKTGKLLFASSLERYTRVKQDGRPLSELMASFPWEKISKVAISVDRPTTAKAVSRSSIYHPIELRNPLSGDRSHGEEFYGHLSFIPHEIEFVPHHMCHAASAFRLSGKDKGVSLVYDGGMSNEEWFGGVYQCDTQNGIVTADLFSAFGYANVTQLYSAITSILGFTPVRHEGKITGLSARGIPNDKCEQVLYEWLCDPLRYHDLNQWTSMYSSKDVPMLLPVPSKVDALKQELLGFSKEDIAATVQKITEEHICEIMNRVLQSNEEKSPHIFLAGGLFANVRVNQRISELVSSSIFVAPPMGDDGAALGAALHVASQNEAFRASTCHSMFLGPPLKKKSVGNLIRDLAVNVASTDDLMTSIAERLASGASVAVCKGKMEFGPRALGNRSILASAIDPQINDTLNARLDRTEFMPFAPICLLEDVDELFEDTEVVTHAAEFMTVAVNCKEKMRKLCPAAVHVDGTARPQFLNKSDHPFVYEILSKYKALTGIPALINTSFNVHEEPIVLSPEDALKGFFESALDTLVLEDQLIDLVDNAHVEKAFIRKQVKALKGELKQSKKKLDALSLLAKATAESIPKEEHSGSEVGSFTNIALQTEINELHRELRVKNEALESLRYQAIGFENRINVGASELSLVNSNVLDLKNELQLVQGRLGDRDSEVVAANATIDRKTNLVEEYKVKIQESQARSSGFEGEINELHRELRNLGTTIGDQQQEILSFESSLRSSQAVVSDMRHALSQSDSKILQLETDRNALHRELRKKNEFTEQLNSRLLQSLSRGDVAVSNVTSLLEVKRQLGDDILQVNSQLSSAEERVKVVEADNVQLNRIRDEREHHIEALELKDVQQLRHIEALELKEVQQYQYIEALELKEVQQYQHIEALELQDIQRLQHIEALERKEVSQLHQIESLQVTLEECQKQAEISAEAHLAVQKGLDSELFAVHSSTSWLITAPLRLFMRIFRWVFAIPIKIFQFIFSIPRFFGRLLLTTTMIAIVRIPAMAVPMQRVLSAFPNLHAHMRLYALKRGIISEEPVISGEDVAVDLVESEQLTNEQEALPANGAGSVAEEVEIVVDELSVDVNSLSVFDKLVDSSQSVQYPEVLLTQEENLECNGQEVIVQDERKTYTESVVLQVLKAELERVQ